MDIGIDRVDNIQYPDQTDEQNKPPGQQTDLSFTFRKLSVRLFIGYHSGAWYPLAKRFQCLVKGPAIRIPLENRPQLRIGIRPRKLRIYPITDQNLNTI